MFLIKNSIKTFEKIAKIVLKKRENNAVKYNIAKIEK